MEQQTVRGTGVVAGFAYAPAAWTRPAPVPPSNPAPITEEDRPAEVERFKRAAQTVVTRFEDRASNATGAASEVLGATAKLAADRGCTAPGCDVPGERCEVHHDDAWAVWVLEDVM